jgi:hypothetical protein
MLHMRGGHRIKLQQINMQEDATEGKIASWHIQGLKRH